MIRISQIKMPLDASNDFLKNKAVKLLKIKTDDILKLELKRKSIDARKKNDIHFICTIDVTIKQNEDKILDKNQNNNITKATNNLYTYTKIIHNLQCRPIIVGSGPAGLFAGYILAKANLNPIIIEQGKDIDSRIKAVELMKTKGILDISTNIQFGEGGAGTFSDGKLNTGIKDPRINEVLKVFVSYGAPKEILYEAKPHIGTDILADVVKNIRKDIIKMGADVFFEYKLEDIIVDSGHITGINILTPEGEKYIETNDIILAIGHSSRDTFKMIYEKGIDISQKQFSMGVRIEHPQSVINKAQYGKYADNSILGAADYKLSCRTPDGRGVYTFCMCPGGEVVAATSEQGGVVTNGMSKYARNDKNANSALLVDVRTSDFNSNHPLAGIELQRKYEKLAYKIGGENYKAPVQLAGDFLNNNQSNKLGSVIPSYKPGITLCDLRECLPDFVYTGLKYAMPQFDRKLNGFMMYDAVMTGIESRSSSPVRIIRSDDYQSNIKGIYPCGEGAGYAGGIMSAAVDGIKCAEKIIEKYL